MAEQENKQFWHYFFLFPIYVYRFTIRPFLPMACRFEPTCSAYAIEAISVLGPFQGIYKIILRLLRCHPWCPGGYDPVLNVNKEIKND